MNKHIYLNIIVIHFLIANCSKKKKKKHDARTMSSVTGAAGNTVADRSS